MSELITYVNENDNKLGVKPRREVYDKHLIHRTVHLLLFNSKGEVLMHKRSKNKEKFPGQYTFSVGGTVSDESYGECIDREIQEELGVDVEYEPLFKYKSFSEESRAFRKLYKAISDQKVNPDESEIAKIEWMSLGEIKQDLGNNPDKYTPVVRKGFDIYFKEA